MIEVLWHGRGGQGAFTAARLLGAAASLDEGKYALAFPSFGPERRGAPMCAFTKMDEVPIGDRSAIKQADYVVYLDETLLADGWEQELKPGGVVLVNSAKPSAAFGDSRIIALDADGISTELLGRPIPNTVFLGALCALCDQLEPIDVHAAIRAYMAPKLHDKNIAVVDAACAQAQLAANNFGEVGTVDNAEALGATDAPLATEASGAAAVPTPSRAPQRPDAVICTLQPGELDPQDFAHTTCFSAGHLVSKNAGWRNERPIIDAGACTGCYQCYFYCPDGAIYKVSPEAAAVVASASEAPTAPTAPTTPVAPVAVDLDFCKGCGVCVSVCKFNALSMISESEAMRS